MDISAPKEWFALLDVLTEEKGMTIVLGETDTGKTTLANFLIFNLCQRGSRVALVDADIGQSTLGPPATIGLAEFKSDPDWKSYCHRRKFSLSAPPHPKAIFLFT